MKAAETNRAVRRKRVGCIVYGVVVLLAAAAVFVLRPMLWTPPADYRPGEWFFITPKNSRGADGAPVSACLRVGSEKRTVVLFCGGGISYNEYMAARSYSETEIPDGFYSDNGSVILENLLDCGIFADGEDNPFRDWNMVVIPYSTADFHVGTGAFAYESLSGEPATLYHSGYTNYQAIMKQARRLLPKTEELLICGYSAGGYAAAMLAEDLIENYFPRAERITLCADSAQLLMDDWPQIFRKVWQAPEEITERIESDNLIVDFYKALYEKYADRMTFLYVSSLWDGELSRYQAYADTGNFHADNEMAPAFAGDLRTMIEQLQAAIPELGVYIYDKLPYTFYPDQVELTQHTILPMDMIYWPLMGDVSVMDWLGRAVQGRVESYGLKQLQENSGAP